MSSGESAKPSGYQERNPFDISRRSEKEVASEIAQRMAAWKQARGRSYAAPATAPESGPAPLGAPVQPARLREFAGPVARPPQPPEGPQPAGEPRPGPGAPSDAVEPPAHEPREREPLSAAFQRAMPPAPSLKRTPALPETMDAPPADARPVETSSPAPEPPVVRGSEPDGSSAARDPAMSAFAALAAAGEMHKSEPGRASTGEPGAGQSQTEPRNPAASAAEREDAALEPFDRARHRIAARANDAARADRRAAGTPETKPEEARETPPVAKPPIAKQQRKIAPTMRVLDRGITYRIEPRPSAAPRGAPARASETAAARTAEGSGAAERGASHRIELPSIETRIEARRIGSLRADPWIAGRQPSFPKIELEPWDGPLPMASQSARPRSGTGWAIGLGALLLIGGITAPAAIWQHGRQQAPAEQDKVAALNPAPEPPAESASQAGSRPVPPEKAEQPAPAAETESNQASAAPAPSSETAAPSAAEQQAKEETLGSVANGGELEPAPVLRPSSPAKSAPSDTAAGANSDSKPAAEASAAPSGSPAGSPAGSPGGSPMIARPFVPEAAPRPTPFRPDSSESSLSSGPQSASAVPPGGASVPIDGASEPNGASVSLKPGLVAQLKPTVNPAANPTGAPQQKAAPRRQPQNPQTLDQMFQVLIDTLSGGQQPNPAIQPEAPSSRR